MANNVAPQINSVQITEQTERVSSKVSRFEISGWCQCNHCDVFREAGLAGREDGILFLSRLWVVCYEERVQFASQFGILVA